MAGRLARLPPHHRRPQHGRERAPEARARHGVRGPRRPGGARRPLAERAGGPGYTQPDDVAFLPVL